MITIMLALTISATAHATTLPKQSNVPGGIAIIPLGITPPDEVTFNNHPVMTLQADNQWQAIVGLPLTAEPGIQNIKVRIPDKAVKTIEFTINDKAYKTQRLTIKNKRKVNPYENDMPQILSDKKRINKALNPQRKFLCTNP